MAILMMSYCHTDEVMRDRIETHLAMLKREGVIETWHDRRIVAGQPLGGSIMAQVAAADVFLCLLSADFIDSHYCYNVEMTRALERHAAGEAAVIPVVLHSCEWHRTPLARLMAVPGDGKPIAKYAYQEDAYLEVAQEIRKAIAAHEQSMVASGGSRAAGSMVRPRAGQNNAVSPTSVTTTGRSLHPRSSNLALRRTFSDADRHTFLEDGFEFIARFFEESLTELQRRNPGVEAKFRRNSGDAFTTRAFRDGSQEVQCKVQLGGGMMSSSSISFSYDANAQAGSSNQMLSVKADDHGLMFDALGLTAMFGRAGKGLSQQGAAEFLWDLFIEPMQGNRRR